MSLYFSVAAPSAEQGQIVEQLQWPARQVYGSVFLVICPPEQMRQVCTEWSDRISRTNLGYVNCHIAAGAELPSPAELMNSQSLQSVIDQLNGQWLEQVLADRQLITYFQPIVEMRNPQAIFAYECLVRGRTTAGEIISPERLFGAARATGRNPGLGSRRPYVCLGVRCPAIRPDRYLYQL